MTIPAYVLATGDIIQTTLVCKDSLGSQYSQNVAFGRVTGTAGVSTTNEDLQEYLDGLWAPLIKPMLAVTAQYWSVIVRRRWPLPVSLASAYGHSAGVGTATGDQLPSQIAGLLTLRTAVAGSGGRGRKYFPFPSEGQSGVNGQPSAGYLALMAAMGVQFSAPQTVPNAGASGTVGFSWGVWKRGTGTLLPFVGFSTQPSWGTQKRRGDLRRPDTDPTAGL